MRLQELQGEDEESKKVRAEELGKEGWKDSDGVLLHQGLSYVPEIIRTELISCHYDDPLAGHFGMEKTRELVARMYYWETLRHDVCLVRKQ